MNNEAKRLFLDTYKKRELIVDSGLGSALFSRNGDRYLDFLSGISINNLGYTNPKIGKNILFQSKKIIHPSNYYYTDPQLALASRLVSLSKLKGVFFANSGTEANEASLAFIADYAKKNPARNELLVFGGSFFGRTYGSRVLATGGMIRNLKIRIIPFNNIKKFEAAVSKKTLGIVLELVLGHGGVRGIDSGLIKSIKRICAKHKLLIMIDEVQTSLGRAGAIFLFQKLKIKPDIVTVGKSLGGGLPLSAVLTSSRIKSVVRRGSYGCTMGGNSLACAAGLALLDTLAGERFMENVHKKEERLARGLAVLAERYPRVIREVRCFGLMCGLEVKEGLAERVVVSCFSNQLLIDVVDRSVIRMLPPLTVSHNEIDEALKILDKSFKEV